MAIDANNKVVDRLVAVSGNEDWRNSTDFYLEAPVRPETVDPVAAPELPQVLSPAAQRIIDSQD